MIPHERWTSRFVYSLGLSLWSSFLFFAGCTSNPTPLNQTALPTAGKDLMDKKLLSLSGHGGVSLNCGQVGVGKNADASSDCALMAFALRSPFYVRYNLQGIDSQVSAGLAADAAGNVYFVEYDSMGWDTNGLPQRCRSHGLQAYLHRALSRARISKENPNGKVDL
jgi:hypothetical protein